MLSVYQREKVEIVDPILLGALGMLESYKLAQFENIIVS